MYAGRVADQPRVKPHREHPSLACRLGLGEQLVDGGAAEAEEVLRRREGAAGRKLGVVGAEGVRQDEVRRDPPVRQGDLRPASPEMTKDDSRCSLPEINRDDPR